LRARHKVLAHGGQARGGQARVRAAAAEGSTSRSRGTATIVEDETRPRDSAVAGEEASTLPSTNGRLAGIVLPRLASAGLLVTPFFFWGTSMVGLKFLAPHTSPLFVAACRLIPAGALVLAWARSQGRPHPTGPAAWLAVVAFAAVDATMFQGCLVEGLKTTSAGLGSVIIDSQPLSVAILSAVFAGEAITATTSAGIAVGLAGLLLLNFTDMPQLPQMRPDVPPPPRLQQAGISRDGDAIPQVLVAPALAVESTERIERAATGLTASASSSSVWGQEAVALLSRAKSVAGGLASSGEFWMLLSAQCMAVGTVMLPWVARYVDPVIATGWHMVLGGIPLLAASALREGDAVLANLAQLTPLDAAVLAYVSIFGGAVGYGVYFYNASKGNLTALVSGSGRE